jgi:GAF domain-containing protein
LRVAGRVVIIGTVTEAILSPATEAASPDEKPSLAAIRQALARLPVTEDAAVLRTQALADLRHLFHPAAIAFLEADAPGACQVVTAWDLPAGAYRPWPAEPCVVRDDGAEILPVMAFGPVVGGVLQEAGLPIVWRVGLDDEEQIIGAVLLFYRDPADQPPVETFGLAQIYMQQLGIRLANAELRARNRNQATQLEAAQAVSEISAALNSHLGEPDVLQLIADRAKDLLVSDGVAINLLEPDGRSVRTLVVSGPHVTHLLDRVYTSDRSAPARVTLTGEAVFWTEGQRRPEELASGIRSALVHPLIGPFGPIGSIGVLMTESPRIFNAADMRLLELFARQAALAITNGRMLERSRLEASFQAAFNQIIEALLVAHSDDEVQARLVETAARLIPCESCYFVVYSSDLTGAVVRHAATRPGAPDMRGAYNPETDWADLMPAILKGDLIYWSRHEAAPPTE